MSERFNLVLLTNVLVRSSGGILGQEELVGNTPSSKLDNHNDCGTLN